MSVNVTGLIRTRDSKDKTISAWLQFQGGRVHVKLVTMSVVEVLKKKARIIVDNIQESKRKVLQAVQATVAKGEESSDLLTEDDLDAELMSNTEFIILLATEAIIDWEEFVVIEDGQEIPVECNEENIRTFVENWLVFASWIKTVCFDLEQIQAAIQEISTKK